VPDGRTFTEAEHQALLQGAVEREIAAATQERDVKITELETRVDQLEAEKAAVEQARDTVQADFDAFKADIEQEREVAAREAERVERVKAAAIHLPDEYFTPQRARRWAEMADEQFAAVVEDFEDAAIAGLSKEQAKELAGLSGEAKASKLAEFRATRQEQASEGGTRETAAFGGGAAPTDPNAGGSKVGAFLGARRRPLASTK
jgi:hypothetical protein